MLTTVLIIAGVIVVMVIINKMNSRGIAQVNAADALSIANDSGALILDVRSSQEFGGGHLKGAKLIPVSELSGRMSEVEKFKDKPVLVYCHAGTRSAMAAQILKKAGFLKVHNLRGGISAWIGNGNKVVK
jgi:rhodanese-related sulfurtransferase